MSADGGAAAFDLATPPADAARTGSGLAFKVLAKGEGAAHPRSHDRVTVNYTGWRSDGKMFDSTATRGQPVTFSMADVIPGWAEGLQLMVEGEKRRFWIPSVLAYGDRPGNPTAPAGSLVFDIELLDVRPTPAPPQVPRDVAAVPRDAKKTASGLAYKVLERGSGHVHPRADSTVEVHYSGWRTDGRMFDSSVTRGHPATFALGSVIKGWTEGVERMVVGERTRFWIPSRLAYGEKGTPPGPSSGMLVFEIELLSIK
jgi:FKBP-type peptidyl-prolyl cis-trans isomerase